MVNLNLKLISLIKGFIIRIMQRFILSALFFGLIISSAFSQKDVPNSKDHLLLSRFEGSEIKRYKFKQFESYTFPTSKELVDHNHLKDSKMIAGEYTFIEYESPEGVTATQIYRTYETQLKKAGFKIEFTCRSSECGDMPMHFVREYVDGTSDLGNSMVGKKSSFIVATGTFENGPYYVIIVVGENEHEKFSRYLLNIIKQDKLDTDKVDVASVTDKMESEGSYAFYGIQFELNSAELKAESAESIEVMADFLSQTAGSEVLIVGHTDNSGDFEMNRILSKKRAEAVCNALVDKYQVEAKRLTAVGVGMASPKASNTKEEGRILNRRVELVLR